MSELEREYKGRSSISIDSAASPEGLAAAERYAFGRQRHGLVALDAKGGDVLLCMPGHNYTKADIKARIDALLN